MAKGGHELTPTGKIRPSIEIMCDWIVRAWNMVSLKIITKSFLKTGLQMLLIEVRTTCCGLEMKMWMWEGIVNQRQRAVSRTTIVMNKVIT
jgi:hypothetical protein